MKDFQTENVAYEKQIVDLQEVVQQEYQQEQHQQLEAKDAAIDALQRNVYATNDRNEEVVENVTSLEEGSANEQLVYSSCRGTIR